MIDEDEAAEIGSKNKQGMKEAADNLYMILQTDKSPIKLTALKECLYANTTKGTYKDLADMISEFLKIGGNGKSHCKHLHSLYIQYATKF